MMDSPLLARSIRHGFACHRQFGIVALSLTLLACASPPAPPLSTQHLNPAPRVAGKAPDFAMAPPLPTPPRPSVRQELYSVVMSNVNVQDLLFALARDAKLNVDIHPSITGTVTMNVHDQTLTEILDRVARQVDLRYEMDGKNLSIRPDSPYLKHYRVDYPNIQRDSKTAISTSTNVASTGGGPGGGGGGGGSGSNASTSSIENTSNNRFWTTLITNLTDLLRETDKVLPEGNSETVTQQATAQSTTGTGSSATTTTTRVGAPRSSEIAATAALAASPNPAAMNTAGTTVVRRSTFREAASVIAHPETGNISVRATQSQHAKVREFLDRVLSSARRQVLIEATIVEVDLSNRYQQGIDWSMLQTGGANAGSGITFKPAGDSSGLQTGGLVSSIATLGFKQFRLWNGDTDLSAMLSLLESFGTLRVLSSPKVSVLNNQSSVLKVVDNKVYFTISVTAGTAGHDHSRSHARHLHHHHQHRADRLSDDGGAAGQRRQRSHAQPAPHHQPHHRLRHRPQSGAGAKQPDQPHSGSADPRDGVGAARAVGRHRHSGRLDAGHPQQQFGRGSGPESAVDVGRLVQVPQRDQQQVRVGDLSAPHRAGRRQRGGGFARFPGYAAPLYRGYARRS